MRIGAEALPLPARRPAGASLWFPPGRLVELTGGRSAACTTLAVAAVLQAQAECETAAWVQPRGGPLFPPDLAESGVDLAALVVVHVAPRSGDYAAPKAAEMLLRSGAIGLVVLDLRPSPPRGEAWLGRILALAREHESRVVMITASRAGAGSLGSLVSLRIEPRRVRTDRGAFAIEHDILKDKLGGFSEVAPARRRGPWGLR
ncbi:MAG: recombinase A [bacterium]